MKTEELNGMLMELGFDLKTNKALRKYYNSAMTGVITEIYELFESDENVCAVTQPWERKAMTMIVYNRAMNGSKIPGCAYDVWTGECDTRDNLAISPSKRLAAFVEVKPATLLRWHQAIKAIDAARGD